MYIKVKFIKDGISIGRDYTYRADIPLKVGDVVDLPSGKGIVSQINVPESEIAAYADKIKSITGKHVEENNKESEGN